MVIQENNVNNNMSLDEQQYVELHCTYCDSQRCTNTVGNSIAERCPYWEQRKTAKEDYL